MTTHRVAIFGHGVIGGGVSRILLNDREQILARTGVDLELAAICTKDADADPEIFSAHRALFREPDEVLADPSISIISETIGGNGIALEFVRRALTSGKHVVTANKKLVALSYSELSALATKHHSQLLFEAAVGGGIPILSTITDGLAGDKITEVEGILNGTTNYILSAMAEGSKDFATALAEAQQLGYAEADPTDDIRGFDTAYKLSILCALVFKRYLPPDHIDRTGITGLLPADFSYARHFGGKIKLLARAALENGRLMAQVSPALVRGNARLAATDGVLNAINLIGTYNTVGNFLAGEGAGRLPTAAAIVSDLIAIAKGTTTIPSPLLEAEETGLPEQAYFLRFVVHDRPGILGEICTVFGRHGISIDAVEQSGGQTTSEIHFALTTFPVAHAEFAAALTEVSGMGFNALPPFVLPVR